MQMATHTRELRCLIHSNISTLVSSRHPVFPQRPGTLKYVTQLEAPLLLRTTLSRSHLRVIRSPSPKLFGNAETRRRGKKQQKKKKKLEQSLIRLR